MPNLSAHSAMVAVDLEAVLPPYAPLVMPKQSLSADVSMFSFMAVALAPLLALLKPSFRSAN
ncbi:hypothetical protein ACEN2J_17195 [Pseudorhodobacter sp. W20_MBD10_FR17]|uniref:hypothetical protein n=1 Tax=Pseudorhodobacter sp. W20_MBD10_FR17 TaxID=3240266 RepID=UPI003F98B9B9